MAGSRFEPATLTITAGETVRWFNEDALPHTVSATDGSWDSGNLPPGQAFERRFDTVGSYAYLCRYHPGMAGTIEVRAQ
jgi:plastocyanin